MNMEIPVRFENGFVITLIKWFAKIIFGFQESQFRRDVKIVVYKTNELID